MQGGLRRPGLAVPEAAPLFEDVEVASEAYTVEKTADELLALGRTTSLFHMIDPARRDAFEEMFLEQKAPTDRAGITLVSPNPRQNARSPISLEPRLRGRVT